MELETVGICITDTRLMETSKFWSGIHIIVIGKLIQRKYSQLDDQNTGPVFKCHFNYAPYSNGLGREAPFV